MALSKEAYSMLEACVGPENISQDPAIIDTYTYQFMAELQRKGTGTRFIAQHPGAVTLPKTAEEVQAIIRTCNRLHLKSKAFSSGWGPMNIYTYDDVVIIDLRRMNRILEIDDKNMYAVVEPYVSWAQLQAELMKLGLNCNCAGVGAQCSALANTAAGFGMGPGCYSMGMNERNVLGTEWVLPDGDILRLGSLGSGAGWFCGDGPGPSLRGILRGEYGTMGGLGVVTKCAIKLYHWPGPAVFPIEGIYPEYRLQEEMIQNAQIFLLTFSDREKRNEALGLLGEHEIGSHMYCWGYGLLLTGVPELSHYLPSKPEDKRPSEDVVIAIALICNSPGEARYQERVLRTILTRTGGEFSPLVDEPGVKADLFRILVRTDFFFSCLFRFAGGWWVPLDDFIGSLDAISLIQEKAVEVAKRWEGKSVLLGCPDVTCQPIYDYSHVGYTDQSGSVWEPSDPESIKNWQECYVETNRPLREQGIMRPTVASSRANKRAGAALSNFNIWQEKIKKSFDPNNISDAGYYIEPE